MNLDALTDARRDEWRRLDELSRRRRLTGAESDELVALYRSASADLAEIKTVAGRTRTGDHVSTILNRARLALTGAPENLMRQLPRFFEIQLPAALYRLRWSTLAITLAFIGVVWLTGWWVQSSPAHIAAMGDEMNLQQYADEDFVSYYSDNPEAVFAGMVWTNNAWIAAQAIMFGITGIYPVYILMQNAFGLGTSAGVMFAFDRGSDFVLFILPHGQLEMMCIFVAAAAGLRVFWALIAPGRMPRGAALAREGRAMATVVVGLIIALGLSGLVEGFVTRQDWPWAIKIGIGSLALGAFAFYGLFFGSRAAKAGETGDLTEFEAGTDRLVAG